MQISIIIPTYNEAELIASSIQIIKKRAANTSDLQIIVADGGSTDQTIAEAKKEGAKIVSCSCKRRSVQMNEGAKLVTGNILYFLHADTHPPRHFDRIIRQQIKAGYPAGCFRLLFDSHSPMLKFYSWCTRFNVDSFRFGDQSLFVTHELFEKVHGFRNDFYLLEGHDIVGRLKNESLFSIAPQPVITSPRKYAQNGTFRLQLIYTFIVVLFKFDLAQRRLYAIYTKWVQ